MRETRETRETRDVRETAAALEIDDLVARYLQTWNETDPGARRKAIDELWADDGVYTDPLTVAVGRDAIDSVIAAVQDQFPGLVFTLAGPVDAHHNLARFTWHLVPQQATFAPSRRPARPLAAPAENPSTSSTRASGRHSPSLRPGGPPESTHRTPLLDGQTLPAGALGPQGEEALVVGFDVAVLGDDGRIGHVHGFLDKVPA